MWKDIDPEKMVGWLILWAEVYIQYRLVEISWQKCVWFYGQIVVDIMVKMRNCGLFLYHVKI